MWENVDAIVWSWRPNKSGPYTRIKIPERHSLKAKACLGLLGIHAQDMDELDGGYNEE